MIDYPHFLNLEMPIGSGAVESSHKQVIHSRMKLAERLAEHHVDTITMPLFSASFVTE